MKNSLILLPLYIGLTFCLTSASFGQELIVGGNMEDESAWNISHLDSQDTTQYFFNYTNAGPAEGDGGCLLLECDVPTSTNILIWQEVTLIGGGEYEVKGAFVDLGGNIENFWCELLLSTEAPPTEPGIDYGGNTLVGFNTWDGTQPGIDGTFQDDYSKGDGPWLIVPEPDGEEVTYYYAINVGVWAGEAPRSFQVAVDEMSLTQIGGTGVKEYHAESVRQFELHQNYPNPFNPTTHISYSLSKVANVSIKIYNAAGELITTLVNQQKPSGFHSIKWNGCNFYGNEVSNGVYFYKMQADNYTETRKMILMK